MSPWPGYERYVPPGKIGDDGRVQRPATRSKYRNTPTVLGGIRFDSKKEATVWQALESLERAGKIRALRRQVNYRLVVRGALVATFRADYVWVEGTRVTVADCKSVATRKLERYRIKARLFAALTGRQIVEL